MKVAVGSNTDVTPLQFPPMKLLQALLGKSNVLPHRKPHSSVHLLPQLELAGFDSISAQARNRSGWTVGSSLAQSWLQKSHVPVAEQAHVPPEGPVHGFDTAVAFACTQGINCKQRGMRDGVV